MLSATPNFQSSWKINFTHTQTNTIMIRKCFSKLFVKAKICKKYDKRSDSCLICFFQKFKRCEKLSSNLHEILFSCILLCKFSSTFSHVQTSVSVSIEYLFHLKNKKELNVSFILTHCFVLRLLRCYGATRLLRYGATPVQWLRTCYGWVNPKLSCSLYSL